MHSRTRSKAPDRRQPGQAPVSVALARHVAALSGQANRCPIPANPNYRRAVTATDKVPKEKCAQDVIPRLVLPPARFVGTGHGTAVRHAVKELRGQGPQVRVDVPRAAARGGTREHCRGTAAAGRVSAAAVLRGVQHPAAAATRSMSDPTPRSDSHATEPCLTFDTRHPTRPCGTSARSCCTRHIDSRPELSPHGCS